MLIDRRLRVYFAGCNLSISEHERLCLAGKYTAVIMAPSAITLPVRGDENPFIEGQKKAPKVVRQIDIEGGKTIAKVSSLKTKSFSIPIDFFW